jgi:hypothetical protein
MSTMLQIIQAATGEMGLTSPTIVIGNNDQIISQNLSLLNGLGNELQREFVWQHINKEYRFTTQYLTTTGTTTKNSPVVTGIPSTTGLDSTYMVVGTGINQDTNILTVDSLTQVTLNQSASASGTVALNFCKTQYALPSDYDRPIDRTQWDKSKHWEMLGPETAQQWQWLKSGFIATGPRIRYRLLGGYFQIWPPISAPEYLGFEYASNAWVMATGSTTATKTAFSADTDTCVYPDRLMISGLKLKYLSAKLFDTTDARREYQGQLDIAKANDGGSQTLSMNPRLSQLLVGWANLPDSNYGP